MQNEDRGLITSIMQPYFLPYIGYFQLISSSDKFIVYDNIKYTKKGWINRNRMLHGDSFSTFSVPLKKASDSLQIGARSVSPEFKPNKLLNRFQAAYRRAPHRDATMTLLEDILHYQEANLFSFLLHSLRRTCEHIGLNASFHTSSEFPIDPSLTKQDKVIALCKAAETATYINPIGGTDLYDHATFADHGIELRFLKSRPVEYTQFGDRFVPWLSIIDVLMFNSLETIREGLIPAHDLHQ
jgi:hypothetical protein